MIKINFQPMNAAAEVMQGMTILEAARQSGVYLESPCGGQGICKKCQVNVNDGIVLACCTPVICDCTVEAPLCGGGGHPRNSEDGVSYNVNADYGLVVDIGTTTLAVSLINIQTGKIAAAENMINPQVQYAQDVVSRIIFAGENCNLNILHGAVCDGINSAVQRLTAQVGITPHDIVDAVYCGNTVMLHLVAGVDPTPLGSYPYTPTIMGGNYCDDVYFPPIISPFVGADIASGILATGLHKTSSSTLFIDIGTNGEIVLAKNGKLAVTSTAAGPAFEGMNISHGKRASVGAIERFKILDDGSFQIATIGNTEPNGICGSGLFDIVAELVRVGEIDTTGRIAETFAVTDNVSVTQDDIRQLQLAKGAIRAGIDVMLKRLNVMPSEIVCVIIAGAFGSNLRVDSLLKLKLLPSEFNDKVKYMGNTSHDGGMMLLLNKDLRRKVTQVVKGIEVFELDNDNAFQDIFIDSLQF